MPDAPSRVAIFKSIRRETPRGPEVGLQKFGTEFVAFLWRRSWT